MEQPFKKKKKRRHEEHSASASPAHRASPAHAQAKTPSPKVQNVGQKLNGHTPPAHQQRHQQLQKQRTELPIFAGTRGHRERAR